jgi:hypothetical protein
MKLHEREDRIFDKYRARGEQIIRDGAITEEYEAAGARLLVILKEPNDTTGNWVKSNGDMRSFGASGGRAATWNNLARWSALFYNPRLRIEEIDVSNQAKRSDYLRRIAVVNLKKIPGGGTADLSSVKRFATRHWDLLEEQLKLCRPTMTIAGGCFDILAELVGSTVVLQEGGRFPFFKDQHLGACVSFYHPQPRFRPSSKLLFLYLKQQLNYHQRLSR